MATDEYGRKKTGKGKLSDDIEEGAIFTKEMFKAAAEDDAKIFGKKESELVVRDKRNKKRVMITDAVNTGVINVSGNGAGGAGSAIGGNTVVSSGSVYNQPVNPFDIQGMSDKLNEVLDFVRGNSDKNIILKPCTVHVKLDDQIVVFNDDDMSFSGQSDRNLMILAGLLKDAMMKTRDEIMRREEINNRNNN